MLVANQGMRREAFVEPSTGRARRAALLRSPSTETGLLAQHPRPAEVEDRTAAASATRSDRYCPGRVPPVPSR